MTPRAEQDLDCTDEEWAAFVKKIEAMGEAEIEQIKERIANGVKELKSAPQVDPSILYYWNHLMGEGDQ